jgi:hypothetical protein
MDQRLAEIYGTNQEQEADTEKLAAAALAEKLEEDGEIDLDNLDAEQLEALAADVLDASGEEASAESAEGDEEGEEQEADGEEAEGETMKLAEADFETADTMGRVMAHAMVQEMRSIESETADEETEEVEESEKTAAEKGKKPGGILAKIRAGAGKASKAIEKGERKAEKFVGRHASKGAKALAGSRVGKSIAKGAKKVGKHGLKALKHLGKHRGKYGLLAAGAAGGAAAMHKEASAIDKLALQRAQEIADEQSQSPYDVLADVVEQRAHEILAANGYEVEE